ncbi:MAG: hypothetical protein ABJF04_21345 [Reichenbachiella sp.]|uniref:hypothetical protein n=1 Tax=Reichenbachiella sp. TaxID=2184521 RepID=UPI003265DC56
MDPFEYVIVLISLILGIGIAQLLNGLADMLAQYKKVKFSTAHTIYILIIFLVFIQDWWYSYQYSKQINAWTLPIVMALLSFPIFLYLLARFLFPTGSRSQETDMVTYFSENWRWLYSFFVSTIVISILQNVYISGLTWKENMPHFCYMGVYLIFIVGNFKNMRYHNVFMILQLIQWIVLFAVDKNMLH